MEYLDLMIERNINPIQNTSIKESCTASLLMMFAAIGFLSKLTCSNKDYEDNNDENRFTSFLNLMGGKYTTYSNEIYQIKRDLFNTGLATKTTFCKAAHSHLCYKDGVFWFNTWNFLDDLIHVIDLIKENIKDKKAYYKNMKKRTKPSTSELSLSCNNLPKHL